MAGLLVALSTLLLCHWSAAAEPNGRDGRDCYGHRPVGYVKPEYNLFTKLAKEIGTDKVTSHDYGTIYGKYFQLLNGRRPTKRLLEIGLGCGMGWGIGKSAQLWRVMFPCAEIYEADVDAKCVEANAANLTNLDIKPLLGSQSDLDVLEGWVAQTKGDFNFIIDDGGHTSLQMYHSFLVLFSKALKPGGVYFLEDLHIGRHESFLDGGSFADGKFTIVDVIKDWIEQLMLCSPEKVEPQRADVAYKPKWPLPHNLKTIECQISMCAFTKCHEDDPNCELRACMRNYVRNEQGLLVPDTSADANL